MLPWFRMYGEFATDIKVQSMDETLQRRFIMFLCLQCNGELEKLSDDELAFALRIDTAELVRTKEVFKAKGFIDDSGKIRNWNKRQYKSDSSTERVQKHRQRHGNGDETLQKRPQIQITDTDTDSEKSKKAAAPPIEFTELRQIYPKRAGDEAWSRALKACSARLKEGSSWDDMRAGAERYAHFCRFTGKIGTEYVKQSAVFFGPDKHFLKPWDLPATKADVRQNANLDAAREFLNAGH